MPLRINMFILCGATVRHFNAVWHAVARRHAVRPAADRNVSMYFYAAVHTRAACRTAGRTACRSSVNEV